MNPIQQRQAAQAGDMAVTPLPSNPLFLIYYLFFCYLPFLFRVLIFY